MFSDLIPSANKAGIALPHFPTRTHAFIFRASEFFTFRKIAEVLRTSEEAVADAAAQMGIYSCEESDVWLKKGYITIVKAMWHLLPYEQLLELLEISEERFANLLKEDDFLHVKLKEKPVCEPLSAKELTDEQVAATKPIREAMESLSFEGKRPFEFEYTVPSISFSGKEKVKTRMIYLFSGLYQTAFDCDSELYCPDELLRSYQSLGINAVWTQGVLYSLTEFKLDPSLSAGYEKRIKNLRHFTERCARFGIKVYLYLNEPRFMSAEFFKRYPHLKGHSRNDNTSAMCISTREVQDYLKDSIQTLCESAPLLGGFITITRSENLTNCYSHSTPSSCNCERCVSRSVGEIIGDVLRCMREGADRVNRDIKIFAWSWGWNEFSSEIIRALPDRVILMCQSEKGAPYNISGVTGEVVDYSMGIIGPSERTKLEWEEGKKRGLELAAKIQVNTTWEGSTTPALPVFPLVNEHGERLEGEGISHYLLSWTLGGLPSDNLMYFSKFYYENVSLPSPSEKLTRACALFSEALREFPFDIRVLYYGPQNGGPSNLLHLNPTGYSASMTCFAYDHTAAWRGPKYSEEIFEKQFALMCEKWEAGLAILEDEPESRTKTMAHSAYCLYRSSLDQIRFYKAREKGDKESMLSLTMSELATARKMLSLMNADATIGYEASNHYYFSKYSLAEKVINCEHIIGVLEEEIG